jgi:hypothetical protein
MPKVPSETPNEPPSEPPYLNSTANWYSGDAWFLFQEIAERCGISTAKFIFENCVSVAQEQEDQSVAIEKARSARLKRRPIKLPTVGEITAADRQQICVWWARLRGTDQKFDAREKQLIAKLSERYVEVGGYPTGFNENHLPPIPEKRNQGDAVLIEIFDRGNPKSAFSIAKKANGGRLTMEKFAASLVPKYGSSAAHILRKLKFVRSGH